MTEAQALRELHRISQQYGADAYTAHQLAEAVLLRLVPPLVAVQFVEMKRGIGFGY